MDEFCWKQNRSTGGVDHDIDEFVKVTLGKYFKKQVRNKRYLRRRN